jgi:sec-independent protein translocase protein TatC
MTEAANSPEGEPSGEGAMGLLEHLDELRSRLFKCALAFGIFFAVCWTFSARTVQFLLKPIQENLFDGGEIIFINLTEPFMIYMKSSALMAMFLGVPVFLYQMWQFVAPGLYKKERGMVVPLMFFGTLFFSAGGAFAYYVAVPISARWLIDLGGDFTANLTLRSAFQFESRMLLGMGAVFEMPIIILFLSRIGLVTPRFLMKHFKIAVLIMAVLSAVITPTGDMLTMSIFAGPMILLYLLGVVVSWVTAKRDKKA